MYNKVSPDRKKQRIMNTIQISSRELYSKCDKLMRVINSKNALPILDNFIFKVKGTDMTISASDTENYATARLQLSDHSDSFEFGVNARTFVSALKEIPEQPLTIKVSNSGCVIRYANGRFNLPIVDVTEYPGLPTLKEPQSVKLSYSSLDKILSKAPSFAGQDELRPIMSGICFAYGDGKLEAAASDGHSLIRFTEKCEGSGEGLFVMSTKTAKLAESFMGSEEENVTISHTNNHSYIKFESFELSSRLVEGKYPNYNAVIPNNYSDYIEFDRKELMSLARRVGVFANSASQLLRLELKGMELNIIGEDFDFSTKAQASMMVSKSGKDMNIGLKSTLILNNMNAFTAETLRMYYMDASRAVLFRPVDEEDNSQVTIQMPMMLNE